MTSKDIFREMGVLDSDLIMKAAPGMPQKKSVNKAWIKWGVIAACLCLAVAGAFRIAIGFIPSQTTDIFREGIPYEIDSIYALPAKYDGKILAQNLELSETADIDFYYKEGGNVNDTDDWYSLIIADDQEDRELLMHCMFGETDVDDWKVSSVFTKDATKTEIINGVDVQIARLENSLKYEYWYYAIFEYDDIVYDVRVQSNDPNGIYDVLGQLLEE